MLDYSMNKIDEGLLRIKKYVENEPDFAENRIHKVLQEYENTTDFIEKYDSLMAAYISCGEDYLISNQDITKFKGFCYLAAKAGQICFKLAEKGHKTYMSCLNENLRTKNNIFYYVRYAIFANRWDLAMGLVPEDSLLGAILMKDYERAKEYLPKDFKAIPKSNETEKMLWSIAKSFPAVYLDSGDLAFIKLAKERGMSCEVNVVELPVHLLDDGQIDEVDWKLPEDKKLDELLK